MQDKVFNIIKTCRVCKSSNLKNISDTKAIQNVTTISGAGVASAKFFQFEGTDATGDATLFQLEVVGGMLQVTDQGDA